MIRLKLSLRGLLFSGLCICYFVFSGSIPASAMVAMQTPELAKIEGLAERSIEQFVHRQFKTAHKTLRLMDHAFYVLHRRDVHKPYNERKERELATMHLWLRQMYIAIRNRSGIGGAIAANQLTASLIRYQAFSDSVKSSIAWLAYLSRDIVLLNMESPKQNASLLEFRRNDLRVTWHSLRKLMLKDMRNKPVTLQMDAIVDHLDKHLDKSDQIEDSKKMLLLIGKLDKAPDPLKIVNKK